MNDYTKEKINVALAKAAECLRDDPARAEKYLGQIKTWVNENTDDDHKQSWPPAGPHWHLIALTPGLATVRIALDALKGESNG